MIPEKLIKLIELLTERTTAKTAIWSKGSAENQFKLSTPEGMAITIIFWSQDYNDPETYLINVFNVNGNIIESFNTHHDGNNEPESFEMLRQLYKAVSNQYYKVEETMDALLASLQSQKVIGSADDSKNNDTIEDDDLPF